MKPRTILQSKEGSVPAKNQSTVFKDRGEKFIAISLAIPEWAAIALTSSGALKGKTSAEKIAALIYNHINADGFYCLEEPTLDESLDYYEEMTACKGNKEIPIEGFCDTREQDKEYLNDFPEFKELHEVDLDEWMKEWMKPN